MIADFTFIHGDPIRIEDLDKEDTLLSLRDQGYVNVRRFGKDMTIFLVDIRFIVWSDGNDEFSCLSTASTPAPKKHGRK